MSTSVDPQQLLTALAPLLTSDGAMKNEAQVPRISGLMNGARKLVSRCIYLNILRATTNEQLLTSFVSGGGWELLNTWLQEAKESNNIAFLTDLLEVFKQLPVTIDTLKKNNTAKLVKQMSKTETNELLKPLAESVVSTWMTVIKQSHENSDSKPPSAAPTIVKKKKIKKIVKKGIPKEGTPSAEEQGESDSNAESSSKKLKSEDGSSSKSEQEDVNERTKKEKEAKKRLSAGSSPKSEKLLKGAKEDDKTSKDDKKPRLGTVKRPAHTKFRSTGIEKESTLPPIKIKKKQPTESLPAINKKDKPIPLKREGPIFGKSLLPPEKKPKVETTPTSSAEATASTTKATPTSSSTTPTTSSVSSSPSTTTSISKTKLIPPKHKQVHESSNFMEALNAPAIPIRKVKPKKPVKPTSPTVNKPLDTPRGPVRAKEETQEGTSAISQEAKPDPPKFRFYSSGQNGEEDAETTESKEEANSATKDNSTTTTTGNLKLVPTKTKKCVKWKEDDKLVDTFYFEMDETERVNVNRPKDFRNAAHLEMVMEREAMKNAKLHVDDNGQNLGNNNLLPWRTPVRIQLVDMPPVDYGINSLEKAIQKQREMVVLQEIYFEKNMIPDTPKEPDPEPFEPKEPTRIPLEDEAADSSQGSTPLYSEPMSGPHPTQAQPPLLQDLQLHNLPPAIASLVQQIPGGHPPNIPPSGPPGPGGMPGEPSSTNATITNVQNLLDSIMGNQQGAAPPTQEELTNKLRDMLEPFKNQLPGSLGPPQPNFPGPPNFNPEGWGPPGHGGPGPGPGRGHGGMGPHFGGPGRGGFNPRFGGPPFPNGPGRFPAPIGPDMGPRGPPRPPMRGGPWARGSRGRGRGGMNFTNRPVCRNYMTPRGCERGQNCRFYHPGVNGPPLTE